MKIETLVSRLMVAQKSLVDAAQWTEAGDKAKCIKCREAFAISNRAILEALEQVNKLLDEMEIKE